MSSGSSKRLLFIIGGVVFTAVVGAAGYFLFAYKSTEPEESKKKPKTDASDEDVQPKPKIESVISEKTSVSITPGGESNRRATEIPLSVTSPVVNETDLPNGMKLYRDERLGLQFISPGIKGKTKMETQYHFVFLEEEEDNISLLIEPLTSSSIKDFVNASFEDVRSLGIIVNVTKQTDTTIGKVAAVETQYTYIYPGKEEMKFWAITAAVNGKGYTLQCQGSKFLNVAKQIAATIEFIEMKTAGSVKLVLSQGLILPLPSIYFESNPTTTSRKPATIFDYVFTSSSISSPLARGLKLASFVQKSLEEVIQQQKSTHTTYVPAGELALTKVSTTAQQFEYDEKGFVNLDVCFAINAITYVATIYFLADQRQHFLDHARHCIADVEHGNDKSEYLLYENSEYKFSLRVPVQATFNEGPSADPIVNILMQIAQNALFETTVACVPSDNSFSSTQELGNAILGEITSRKEQKTTLLDKKVIKIGSFEAFECTFEEIVPISGIQLKWLLHAVYVNNTIYYIRSYTESSAWSAELEAAVRNIHNSFRLVRS